MKNTILLICILFSTFSSFAQWQNLGQHYFQLQMMSNGIGYSFENTIGPTPATGTTFQIKASLNDWNSEYVLDTGGGTDYGCCPIICMSFHNLSTGIRAKGSQNFCNFQKTTDYGQTWTNFSGNLTYFPRNLILVNDTLGYMTRNYSSTLSDGRIYRITPTQVTEVAAWDTMQFSNNGSFDFSDYGAKCNMEFVNDSTGFVALFSDYYRAHIMKTSDFGTTWNKVLTDYENNFTSISFGDESTGYASTMFGGLHKTSDGGSTWSAIVSPTTSHINSIDFANADNGYIVCDFGEIYRTVNGGNSWITENSGLTTRLISVQVVDQTCAYAISENRVLIKNENPLSLDVNETGIAIYPNPAANLLTISADTNVNIEHVDIYDQYGKLVMISTESQIDISELTAGVYTVSVYSTEGIINSKMVKK